MRVFDFHWHPIEWAHEVVKKLASQRATDFLSFTIVSSFPMMGNGEKRATHKAVSRDVIYKTNGRKREREKMYV